MKRWHWFSVALLAVVFVAALLAVPPFRGGMERAQAGDPVPGDINGDTVHNTGDVHLDIDMAKSPTGNWCDTDGAGGDVIDTTATHAVGETYQVAICLTDSPLAPTGFDFQLVYDDSLNQCVPVNHPGPTPKNALTPTPTPIPCLAGEPGCLDSNPDANTGDVVYSDPSLGSDPSWTCAIQGLVPVCDQNTGDPGPGAGAAFISCMSTTSDQGDLTLPTGIGVSAPIAVLTFHAKGSGTDTLRLNPVHVIQLGGGPIVVCPPVPGSGDPNRCNPATDIKTGTPEPTQVPGTATPTVVPTATPICGRAVDAGSELGTISVLPTCAPTAKAYTKTPTPAPTEIPTAAPSGGGGGGGSPPPPPPPAGGTGPVVSPPSTGDGSGGVPWATGLIWLMAGLGAISLVSGGLCFRHAGMRK